VRLFSRFLSAYEERPLRAIRVLCTSVLTSTFIKYEGISDTISASGHLLAIQRYVKHSNQARLPARDHQLSFALNPGRRSGTNRANLHSNRVDSVCATSQAATLFRVRKIEPVGLSSNTTIKGVKQALGRACRNGMSQKSNTVILGAYIT